MYPSLCIDTVSRVVAEEFLNCDLEVELDWEELSLYLSIIIEKEIIEKNGLSEFVHTRLKNKGIHPTITTEEIIERTDKTKSKLFTLI